MDLTYSRDSRTADYGILGGDNTNDRRKVDRVAIPARECASQDEGAVIFLVNEAGIIMSIAARHIHAHMTHVQSGLARGPPLARSHENNETSRTDAQLAAEQAKVRIAELEADLSDVTADLSTTKTALAKEKQRTRRLWQQQCE